MIDDSRRFQLLIIIGLLTFGNLGYLAVRDPTPAQAQQDTPILVAATSETPTTAAAPTTTETPIQPSGEVTRGAAAPVAPPSNAYAPEPIQEIGTIEIPKIGLNHRIFHGISMRNIDNGPSHWPGTALPGEAGNAVFAGHRVTHSHPFRNIDQLANGDQVHFTVQGVRTTYVVTSHEVVTPKGLHIVQPTPEPTATLFACHPPGSAKFRYVIHLALLAE